MREKAWRFRIAIREAAPGRVEIRVRPRGGPERRFSNLEEFYRYLLERLRYDPGRLLS